MRYFHKARFSWARLSVLCFLVFLANTSLEAQKETYAKGDLAVKLGLSNNFPLAVLDVSLDYSDQLILSFSAEYLLKGNRSKIVFLGAGLFWGYTQYSFQEISTNGEFSFRNIHQPMIGPRATMHIDFSKKGIAELYFGGQILLSPQWVAGRTIRSSLYTEIYPGAYVGFNFVIIKKTVGLFAEIGLGTGAGNIGISVTVPSRKTKAAPSKAAP